MIIIFEQDLTHYRASFYDYLAKHINYEILIVYGEGEPNSAHTIEDGGTERKFKTLEIKRYWLGRLAYFQSFEKLKRVVKHNDVKCVIHRGAIRNLGLYREISFFKNRGIPVILRGIGFSNKRVFNPNKNISDFYHRKVVQRADAYLCYTHGSKKILDLFYNPKKIFVAVNTLNSSLLSQHYEQLNSIGIGKIKNELGLNKGKYLIHVGRFAPRKNLKKLIKIYADLKKESSDLGLILIGDGPEKESLFSYVKENNISNVVFTGSISSENILVSRYIFSSDIFVITGNIGLSINHSFLFGIPVVGYVENDIRKRPKGYIHGPEHEHLIDGYNGIIANNDSVECFFDAIKEVLMADKYAINAYKYAQENLTVEKMTDGYINAIEYVINK
jgi:glycosyltransferase involved in cell wall biosynthesis